MARRSSTLVDPCLLQGAALPGAGSVMHATDGELDIRELGGLRHKMPTPTSYFPDRRDGAGRHSAALPASSPRTPFWLAAPLDERICDLCRRRGHGAADRHLQLPRSLSRPSTASHATSILRSCPRKPAMMTIPLWILAVLHHCDGCSTCPSLLTLEALPGTGHRRSPRRCRVAVELLAYHAQHRHQPSLASSWPMRSISARRTGPQRWPSRFAVACSRRWRTPGMWTSSTVHFIVRPLKAVSGWFAGCLRPEGDRRRGQRCRHVTLDAGELVRKLQNGAIPTYALSIFLGVVVCAAFIFAGCSEAFHQTQGIAIMALSIPYLLSIITFLPLAWRRWW